MKRQNQFNQQEFLQNKLKFKLGIKFIINFILIVKNIGKI